MSDDVLVKVEGVSKKFCPSLKRSLWYGVQDAQVPRRPGMAESGRVGSLIELGAGFNPILTARENIYVNGSVPPMASAIAMKGSL
jgi:hypothetical protein